MEKTSIEKLLDLVNCVLDLSDLQQQLGYVKGPISTVAMLGLVGESGEVLAETMINTSSLSVLNIRREAVQIAAAVDGLKKAIRIGNDNSSIILPSEKEDLFDKELADAFYYLNALAINRGFTIFQLAKMAHDKVRAKQAAGGSSEDKR